MSEVLLYGSIYSQSAIDFITAVNEVEDDELITRINCTGGEPAYGWGIITKINEFEGSKLAKVDGQAHSMAAFALLYMDDVESNDTSEFCIHRAAYHPYYEKEYMSDAEKTSLININKSLEKAFRNVVDVAKFEAIAGFTVKEMFSLDDRKEVFLTAIQAKQIGLIKRIVKITPEKRDEINARVQRVAAQHSGISEFKISKIVAERDDKPVTNKNKINMTIEELQAQHPALYASVLNKGIEAGVAKENDRVGSWAAFLPIDAKAAQAGIESGKEITATATAQFQVTAMTKGALKTLEAEGKKGPEAGTDKPEGTEIIAKDEEAKKNADFIAKMNASAGIVEPEKTKE